MKWCLILFFYFLCLKAKLVKQFSSTELYLTVNNDKRIFFSPVADTVTLLTVSGSFRDNNLLRSGRYASTVKISSNFINSSAKVWKFRDNIDKSKGLVDVSASTAAVTHATTILTAVISVSKGEISGITWDDGCSLCGGIAVESDVEKCRQTTFNETSTPPSLIDGLHILGGQSCVEPVSQCGEGDRCSLKVYVVWTGTDVDGKFFRSAGNRFSRMNHYKTLSLYESAVSGWYGLLFGD